MKKIAAVAAVVLGSLGFALGSGGVVHADIYSSAGCSVYTIGTPGVNEQGKARCSGGIAGGPTQFRVEGTCTNWLFQVGYLYGGWASVYGGSSTTPTCAGKVGNLVVHKR